MEPTVTPFYAAAITALFILLAARVILFRRGQGVSLGDGGSAELLGRIRAHANCAEYAPLGLLLLLLAELTGAPPPALHAAGLLLLLGRMSHGWSLSGKRTLPFRVTGMVLTFLSLGLSVLLALI